MAGRVPEDKYDAWMAARTKHGGYAGGRETPEHYVWRSMHARCNDPARKEYASYGGRGISVCEAWSDYAAFLADMGPRPSPKHSLERVDNDGPYSPDNCRWALGSDQQKNKRNTVRYTNGVFTGTPAECAEYLGISRALASYRMKVWGTYEKGVEWWPAQKAV
jgi:hypothetical protein